MLNFGWKALEAGNIQAAACLVCYIIIGVVIYGTARLSSSRKNQ